MGDVEHSVLGGKLNDLFVPSANDECVYKATPEKRTLHKAGIHAHYFCFRFFLPTLPDTPRLPDDLF